MRQRVMARPIGAAHRRSPRRSRRIEGGLLVIVAMAAVLGLIGVSGMLAGGAKPTPGAGSRIAGVAATPPTAQPP